MQFTWPQLTALLAVLIVLLWTRDLSSPVKNSLEYKMNALHNKTEVPEAPVWESWYQRLNNVLIVKETTVEKLEHLYVVFMICLVAQVLGLIREIIFSLIIPLVQAFGIFIRWCLEVAQKLRTWWDQRDVAIAKIKELYNWLSVHCVSCWTWCKAKLPVKKPVQEERRDENARSSQPEGN